MTNEDALVQLKALLEYVGGVPYMGLTKEDVQAMRLAVWLLERESLVREAIADIEEYTHTQDYEAPIDRLVNWERQNPRPG